jgi:threonine dehydrogenase-like Zn-dependent dehydrogenase
VAVSGVEKLEGPRPMGHKYAGIVEEVGAAVTTMRPGQFVVGSFFASDNTCEVCRAGSSIADLTLGTSLGAVGPAVVGTVIAALTLIPTTALDLLARRP